MQGFNLIVGNTRVTGSHQPRRSASDWATTGAGRGGGLGVGNIAGTVDCDPATLVVGKRGELAIAETGDNANAVTITNVTANATAAPRNRAKLNINMVDNFNAGARLFRSAVIARIRQVPAAATSNYFALVSLT